LSSWRELSMGWLLLCGCGEAYPLPPTACDDYCRVVQRNGCDDDEPAGCVRECEEAAAAAAAQSCDEAWSAQNRCLLSAEPASFVCQNGRSRIPDTCLDERRAVSECLAPGSGACFDQCVRQATECRADLLDCEAACQHPNPDCRRVDTAYDRCRLDYAVECRAPFEADPRAPEDIPCFDEALAVLSCAKFQP
jgi:hypothetical protein